MTNGQCERFNSTLCNMLGTLFEQDKLDWKAHLSSMTHAYNCTQHPSTTYSPYFLMFGRQPRPPIDFEMGLPIYVLGDSCSKTRYVQKLKQRLNFAYKKAKEMSQKQAQKYKTSYDKKIKGTQLRFNDIVLVKRVAWKGRHKIQNKWEPSEYVVIEQPNLKVPVYKVKSLEDIKIRVLHRNMLLPLGIKFIPEDESEQDSEEEPEFEKCSLERLISERISQPSIFNNMAPSAQTESEQGQEAQGSSIEHKELPEIHVNIDSQQGSMAPPTAFSSDQLIDPQMSVDPQFLVPTDDSVGSDPTQITHLSDKYNDTSLKLPSTEDNSDSLKETKEILEFVDELSQEPSPCQTGRVHLNKMTLSLLSRLKIVHTQLMLTKLLRVLTAHLKAKTFLLIKCQKRMVLSLQTFLSLKVNLVQLCHIVKKVLLLNWILRVQVNSCQHNLVIRKTQLYLMRVQILSLKWGFQMTALKIVLLVLLLARFLQKIPMISLILFLALTLKLQLVMVICKLVNVLMLKSFHLCHRGGYT